MATNPGRWTLSVLRDFLVWTGDFDLEFTLFHEQLSCFPQLLGNFPSADDSQKDLLDFGTS